MIKHLYITLIIAALLPSCNPSVQGQRNITPTGEKSASCTKNTDKQQLQRDIGQMLLVGFRGTSIDSNSTIVRDIRKYHVGSVILFEYDAPTGTRHRNIESPQQLRRLCADLQKYANGDLLIGVDQEGGYVTRLRTRDGFAATKTAQASTAHGDSSVADNASIIASELSNAGINLNFAPCIDVNINPQCPIIGKLGRSFSDNPNDVTRYANIWIDIHRGKGIVSCLKHFPGHGSSTGDTHAGLVDITDTWQDSELSPYRDLIDNGNADMIMVAHVVNKHFGDSLPASLSPACVTQKLRNKLGFTGVVVTDDLAMGAITKQYGFEEALKLSILAGCDLLCISNNGTSYDPNLVPHAVNAILQFVEEGTISPDAIHESAERIRTLKAKVRLP